MIMTEGLMDFLKTFSAKRGWEGTGQAAEDILKGSGTANICFSVGFVEICTTHQSRSKVWRSYP
jgi:hypothetical protein